MQDNQAQMLFDNFNRFIADHINYQPSIISSYTCTLQIVPRRNNHGYLLGGSVLQVTIHANDQHESFNILKNLIQNSNCLNVIERTPTIRNNNGITSSIFLEETEVQTFCTQSQNRYEYPSGFPFNNYKGNMVGQYTNSLNSINVIPPNALASSITQNQGVTFDPDDEFVFIESLKQYSEDADKKIMNTIAKGNALLRVVGSTVEGVSNIDRNEMDFNINQFIPYQQGEDESKTRPSNVAFILNEPKPNKIFKYDPITKRSDEKTYTKKSLTQDRINKVLSKTKKMSATLIPAEPRYMNFFSSSACVAFLWDLQNATVGKNVYAKNAYTKKGFYTKTDPKNNPAVLNNICTEASTTIDQIKQNNIDDVAALKKKEKDELLALKDLMEINESMVRVPRGAPSGLAVFKDDYENRLMALRVMYETKHKVKAQNDIPILIMQALKPHKIYTHAERIQDVMDILNADLTNVNSYIQRNNGEKIPNNILSILRRVLKQKTPSGITLLQEIINSSVPHLTVEEFNKFKVFVNLYNTANPLYKLEVKWALPLYQYYVEGEKSLKNFFEIYGTNPNVFKSINIQKLVSNGKKENASSNAYFLTKIFYDNAAKLDECLSHLKDFSGLSNVNILLLAGSNYDLFIKHFDKLLSTQDKIKDFLKFLPQYHIYYNNELALFLFQKYSNLMDQKEVYNWMLYIGENKKKISASEGDKVFDTIFDYFNQKTIEKEKMIASQPNHNSSASSTSFNSNLNEFNLNSYLQVLLSLTDSKGNTLLDKAFLDKKSSDALIKNLITLHVSFNLQTFIDAASKKDEEVIKKMIHHFCTAYILDKLFPKEKCHILGSIFHHFPNLYKMDSPDGSDGAILWSHYLQNIDFSSLSDTTYMSCKDEAVLERVFFKHEKIKNYFIENRTRLIKEAIDKDNMPLAFCILKNHIKKLIQEKKIKVNIDLNDPLNSLLHLIVLANDNDLTNFILDFKGSQLAANHKEIQKENTQKLTPLKLALQNENFEVVVTLLTKDNNLQLLDNFAGMHSNIIKFFHYFNTKIKPKNSRQSLLEYAYTNDFKVVFHFLCLYADESDFQIKNKDDDSIIDILIQGKKFDYLQLLIPRLKDTLTAKEKNFLFYRLTAMGQFELAEKLNELITPNEFSLYEEPKSFNRTALYYLALHASTDAAKALPQNKSAYRLFISVLKKHPDAVLNNSSDTVFSILLNAKNISLLKEAVILSNTTLENNVRKFNELLLKMLLFAANSNDFGFITIILSIKFNVDDKILEFILDPLLKQDNYQSCEILCYQRPKMASIYLDKLLKLKLTQDIAQSIIHTLSFQNGEIQNSKTTVPQIFSHFFNYKMWDELYKLVIKFKLLNLDFINDLFNDLFFKLMAVEDQDAVKKLFDALVGSFSEQNQQVEEEKVQEKEELESDDSSDEENHHSIMDGSEPILKDIKRKMKKEIKKEDVQEKTEEVEKVEKESINQLPKFTFDPNHVDDDGNTALHLLCKKKPSPDKILRLELEIQNLLDFKSSVVRQNTKSHTPICLAINAGLPVSTIKILISHVENDDIILLRKTEWLEQLCGTGSLELVQDLLDKIPLDTQDKIPKDNIFKAVVQLLARTPNNLKETPLKEKLLIKLYKAAEIQPFDILTCDFSKNHLSPLTSAAKQKLIDLIDKDNWDAEKAHQFLEAEIANSRWETVKLFLDKMVDNEFTLPKHIQIKYFSKLVCEMSETDINKRLKYIKALINLIDQSMDEYVSEYQTALKKMPNSQEILSKPIRDLLSTYYQKHKMPLLLDAVKNKEYAFIEWLCFHGVNPVSQALSKDKQSPLEMAIQDKDRQCVIIFMKYGVPHFNEYQFHPSHPVLSVILRDLYEVGKLFSTEKPNIPGSDSDASENSDDESEKSDDTKNISDSSSDFEGSENSDDENEKSEDVDAEKITTSPATVKFQQAKLPNFDYLNLTQKRAMALGFVKNDLDNFTSIEDVLDYMDNLKERLPEDILSILFDRQSSCISIAGHRWKDKDLSETGTQVYKLAKNRLLGLVADLSNSQPQLSLPQDFNQINKEKQKKYQDDYYQKLKKEKEEREKKEKENDNKENNQVKIEDLKTFGFSLVVENKFEELKGKAQKNNLTNEKSIAKAGIEAGLERRLSKFFEENRQRNLFGGVTKSTEIYGLFRHGQYKEAKKMLDEQTQKSNKWLSKFGGK